MADYWKSQPRKFCQYCKCWIADNKPSVEFHERGKNHKENVAAKISEIKKKSIEKAKQEERMSKEFAAMEEAALKAYQEDLKRIEREADGSSSPTPAPAPAPTKPKPRPQPQAQPQPKKRQKKEQKVNKRPREQRNMQVWVEGRSDDGHVYFYNTITGESQWSQPEVFHGASSASAQSEQTNSSPGCAWMEAVSPDGFTYYYNTVTGESSWKNPADVASTEVSASSSESNKEVESREEPSTPREEPSTPQPEPLSGGGEESSNGAPASQEAEVPEETDQQSKVPKISFRKRQAESDAEEKEGEDKTTDDSPKEDDKEKKKEEEEVVQSTTAEPQKTQEPATIWKIRAKRPKGVNPYGVWEKIKQVEDPYAKVDLQLPKVERSAVSAPTDLPPEPKPKFKERIITSLGEEGGPASFRKNKTQNGKSRSFRQRDDDD
ncbi:WW domain-binding protein 4 [Brachyistius frenatus]|uniref:WW domain-binding protein 4 n=1 Tax=Brachyistius frenatus TaxID=100188 RepID=UPI0037E7D227